MAEAGPSIPNLASSTTNPTIPTIASTTLPASTPTLLNTLHSLLVAHSSKNLSSTHLHPYAPLASSRKGKGKGKAQEIDEIRGLKDSVQRLKVVLSGVGGEGDDEGRLIRGLREISSHQLPLLQQLTSLPLPLPQPSNPTSIFPSKLLTLHPIKLLEAISHQLDLQCFIEDSQFGLLKSSLAIAGTRFVIDVDLETSSSSTAEDDEEEEGEGDVDMVDGTSTPAPLPPTSAKKGEVGDEKNRIKLSKLVVNHVTSSGGTARSVYTTKILKGLVEDYLRSYHSSENVWEKQGVLDRLVEGLRELKDLDVYSISSSVSGDVPSAGQGVDAIGTEGRDGFEEVEKIQLDLERMYADESTTKTRMYYTSHTSIFPTFHLLPRFTSEEYHPTFKIRPSTLHEDVRIPSFTNSTSTTEPQDSDVNMNDTRQKKEITEKAGWVIEILPENGMDGIAVRQNWLNHKHEKEEEENEQRGNGIRVENLLYRPFPPPPIPSMAQQVQMFPYTSTFSHTSVGGGIGQKWSMVQPGSIAFVLGRIGMSGDIREVENVLASLRNQIVLNNLFSSVFIPSQLQMEESVDQQDGDDVDDDNDINDWLSGDQKSIPINLSLSQSSIDVTFPLIRHDKIENIEIIVKPCQTPEDGYVSIRVNGEDLKVGGDGGKRDLVRIVREVIKTRSRS